MGCYPDRIDAALGACPMAPFPGQSDFKEITRAVHESGPHTGHSSRGPQHMLGQCCIRLPVFKQAVLQHLLGAVHPLFTGLKHQHHGPTQLVLPLFQHFSRRQQTGGVHIVPTGMHAAVLRSKGLSALFLHGERIHVRPQQEGFSRFSHRSGNSGFSHPSGLIPKGTKLCQNEFRGIRQVKSQLRMAVQIPAPLPDFPAYCLRAGCKIRLQNLFAPILFNRKIGTL